MHRFAIGVLAGIVSLVLGVTLYAGHEARAYYLDALAAVPEHPYFAVHSVAYRRGFLRSSAVTVVELRLPAMPGNTGEKYKPVSLQASPCASYCGTRSSICRAFGAITLACL